MKISNSNERIRYLLDYFQLNQTEFCKRTNINKSALSNYLSGTRMPRQDQIDAMTRPFNINPAWLMGYDVPMFNDPDKIIYSNEEIVLIESYRKAAPAIQESVNKLLDVPTSNKKLPGQTTLFNLEDPKNE